MFIFVLFFYDKKIEIDKSSDRRLFRRKLDREISLCYYRIDPKGGLQCTPCYPNPNFIWLVGRLLIALWFLSIPLKSMSLISLRSGIDLSMVNSLGFIAIGSHIIWYEFPHVSRQFLRIEVSYTSMVYRWFRR